MFSYYWFQFKRSIKRFVLTPYVGPRKLLNACAVLFQAFVTRNSRVLGNPLKLTMDPSSSCMLKCPLCPTGTGRAGRPKGLMEFKNFKKVVDEMAPYLYEIDLNNWGEPFLNKQIFEMAEYAHKKRIRTSINTNLNVPLSEKEVERLIRAGLDQLYVSCDGITQQSYAKYRISGKLEKVFNNLKLVARKKKELGKKNPRVVWQFLAMKHNEKEIPLLEAKRQELGVEQLVVGCVRGDLDREIFNTDEQKLDSLKDWLPEDEKLSRYDYKEKKRKLQKKFCYFPWLVSVVNWDGSVSPCCGVFEKRFDFGNAFEQGFKKIWNNELYQEARKTISRKPHSLKTICENCLRTGFID